MYVCMYVQDKDSLPLLPVLQSGQVGASRFSKEVLHCPLGMISGQRHQCRMYVCCKYVNVFVCSAGNQQIVQQSKQLKEIKVP